MGRGAARFRGERLGPYEIVRLLGRGGTGEVWEAVLHGPAGFKKPVALKCLRPERVADPRVLEALQREARLGARLQHPNVVGTLGISEHGGVWVLALELVRGAPLSELVRELGRLPGRVVLDVGIQAASGLAHAHDAGLVHRDVKPGNLLVDQSGVVRVADLGISMLPGEAGLPAGTPGYAAPEQLLGQPEPRSDLYGLGIVLAVIASGRRPGEVRDLDLAVAGLTSVVTRCLAPDPEQRFARARDLADALAALRSRQPEGGPTLRALLQRLRPSLEIDVTPTGVSDVPTRLLPPGNLPPARDRLVGRDRERAALLGLVTSGERLLVLLGPGGSGKTRLALEVARAARGALAGGAFAIDLSEARSVAGLCSSVGAGLGLERAAEHPIAQLGHVFHSKGRALFVLDNLEQCVDHLPATLGVWRDRAPEATFLCTSRVALGLQGERSVQVEPLPTGEAVALFTERAGGALRDDDRSHVAPLCEALDGMPLAIELAAARVAVLGVERIRTRLSPALLSGGGRERPARHRSVEASLDWSAELLSAAARAALAQLAMFEGGFELEAAEGVLDLPGACPALAVLEELVGASLLRVDARGGRFSMLVVVHEYAARRLGDGERAAAEVRHGRHFAEMANPDAVHGLHGPRGADRLEEFARELENLVAACRRAVARDDPAVAVPVLRAIWEVVDLRGPLSLVPDLAASVTALPGLTPPERAQVERIAGRAWAELGRVDAARAHGERALALFSSIGDRRGEGAVANQLAMIDHRARPGAALARLSEALRLVRDIGDQGLEGITLGNLGLVFQLAERPDEARAHYAAAVDVLREVGSRRSEGIVLVNLGTLHRQQGRTGDAWACFDLALAAHREVGDRWSEGIALCNLGNLLLSAGRLDEAETHYQQSLAIHRATGNRQGEGTVMGNLGGLYGLQGRADEAHAHFEQALSLHREVGDREAEGYVLGCLGALLIDAGRLGEARAHLDRALALHREGGHTRAEGIALGDLGLLHLEAGDPGAARACLGDALRLLRSVAAEGEEGLVLVRLARAEATGGDPVAAQALLLRAEPLLRVVGDRSHLAELHATRSEVLWRGGDAAGARRALADAVAAGAGSAPACRLARLRALLDSTAR